ncbi:host factor-I protein [Caldicoprobacter guelmensis]|uniref:RNA chaperone Hfq n=1 Tax=Caldicoprobacter guelmensis TaxID=1170224 RepID=UPI001956B2EC|nr:RNA chaperone Hfq [Caldicoprobacter guelmensis]MBM7581439.1 host factor-I protein [Caldicoprobacter guelmensis]
MANKATILLQDAYLNQLRKERIPVTIHLINGFQLKGLIKGFDNFIILFESEGKQMMIYKHAVSTVTPARQVNFASGNNNSAANNAGNTSKEKSNAAESEN